MSNRERARDIVPDVLLVGGAASVAYGAWLTFPPAGFVLAGLFAMYAGLKLARS
jgi:hypothetical protein